ncbi:MAG: hypothetical protein N2Z60_02360 [Elusimicrobiales bacterium]|nr:hypothetical protein [Elusimicrobiales bacterium]
MLKIIITLIMSSCYLYSNEFHLSNEFSVYYNDITGDGKSQSALTDGLNYLDTLNLNGMGEKNDAKYNYNIGLKFTDDKRNDIKNISLTNLSGSFVKKEHTVNLGDIFESFSQYTLASSLKGAAYKFNKQDSKLPKITALFGYAYPRWDSVWKDPDTRVSKKQAYGIRVSEKISDLELGLNYLNTKDVELVNETQKYDSSNYSLDLNYIPMPGLTMNGEFAKSDTDEKLANANAKGNAYRFEIVGDADPSRVSIEYENVDPDYLSLMGSAVPDRRKIKTKWRYKYSKMITFNTGFLWYRDNLENQKANTTYSLRPEISMSVKKIFKSRPYSFADFSYKFDRKYGVNSQKDHYFNINYRDKFKDIDNDTNLGYTLYKTDKNVRNASEINFNTSFSSRIEKEDTVIRPSLNLGSWYSNDELSNQTDKIYEYSLGLGYEKPQKGFSADIRLGQNFLRKEVGDDSDKLFASLNCYYKTRIMKYDSTIFLRTAYNNYNFSTNSNDFREKSITLGVNTAF